MSAAKHLIIGTAGHIDHGKTTLIRALTGTNTDRLKEEQERGITIELGFAHLELPSGVSLGIVDVPGHEKFVRHMVAGAAGMDLVMLVIAADEGIMPQTREHLDICRMLGIKRGLVALTKSDLCEPDWIELISGEVGAFVKGTFLDGAPVIPVSSSTGEGLPDLLAALETLVRDVQPRPSWGIFRMPVDRVFTMKGFGTVVTGTTVSGTVKVGETVRVYPRELETKVRGLQVHNAMVEAAEAGHRTAINLQGVEKDEVRRGDVVGHPGAIVPSFILDVRLRLLASAARPLETRTRARFHLGTAELLGRVHLLEGDELAPGGECLAQVRLEEPTAALAHDRFVMRSYSPAFTIGGGTVIDPAAGKVIRRKKTLGATVSRLGSLERGSPAEALAAQLLADGPGGGTIASLSRALNMDDTRVAEVLAELEAAGAAHRLGTGPQDAVLHAGTVRDLAATVREHLERFHREQPLKPGLPREELKTKLPKALSAKGLAWLMEHLERTGAVGGDGKLVRLAGWRVQLDGRQQEARDRIEAALKAAGLTVPSPAELSASLRSPAPLVASLLGVLTGEGTLVKVSEEIYLHREHYDRLLAAIEAHLAARGELSVGDFKELTGLTRKYSIPVLEHVDRLGITLRVGDSRVARKR